MQFLILAYDDTDAHALERRMSARPAHIALGDKMRAEGCLLFASAILDENEKMIGSMLVTEFGDRQLLNDWLKIEPYVISQVWKSIEVRPCKVGPSFSK